MVEVRLITYRRPLLLKRALECLRAQTYDQWQAVIFDDSPDQEGQDVVSRFQDARIHYRANPQNLGMVRNTSQAFAPTSYLNEAQFACVLEDDNLYDPELLAANIAALKMRPHAVLARNYRMVDVEEDGTETLNPDQPMMNKWGAHAREIGFEERLKEAFFSYTLGNLGYFWRLGVGIDLSIAEETLHGPVSEVSRAVAFDSPCWYEPQALAVFSRFVNKRQTPRAETSASVQQRRQAKCHEIQFTHRLIQLWTQTCGYPLTEILSAAKTHPNRDEALQRLAEADCWPAWWALESHQARLAALKARLVFSLPSNRFSA